MNTEDLIQRIDSLISKGQEAVNKGNERDISLANTGLWAGFRSASLSFIKNLYGERHPFYTEFNKQVQYSYINSVKAGINILLSIKTEIENGWLISYKKLVSAEVFSDFLEMGKYLLDNGYKDPAAVIIGSVLEDHLRFLCRNNSIAVTHTSGGDVKSKKADLLNSDLAKAGVYGVLEQKSVTAWLDLRNKAAHGKYDEYQIEQVNLMYLGVLNFITTTN
jgi:hypothetical protein